MISCNAQDLIAAAKCFTCISRGQRKSVITYLMCQYANRGLVVATAWALQVVANGGPVPSTKTIGALADFVSALDRAGIWSKMLDVNFFAPDSLIAALTPCKVTYARTPWTNNNFVAGDLSINGLKGDGLTKYLDTGINLNNVPGFFGGSPTVFPGMSVYVSQRGAPDFAFQCEMSFFGDTLTFYADTGGSAFFDCYGAAGGRITAANALWTGFASGNRIDALRSAIYKGNSVVPFQLLVSSNTNNTTQAAQDGSIFVFAKHAGAPAGQYVFNTLSFSALHYGLESADCQSLFNAVQALRVALGGGFV